MSDALLIPEEGTIALSQESDTRRFGAALGDLARTGDVIALYGPLGAGKTTLARGFIQHLLKSDEDVVSPTFTLVQTYDTERGAIWHFDLYRIENPNDVVELGWDDALADGISLVEWPEHAGSFLPPTALKIELSSDPGDSVRQVRLAGGKLWHDRLNTLADHVR